jgi:cation:H+ antiporter
VLFKPLEIRPAWIRRDGMLMLGGVVAMTFLLWTGNTLERWEGALLAGSYVFYIVWLLKFREQIRIDEMEIIGEIKTKDRGWTQGAYLVMIATGLSFAVYASTQLVEIAVEIATSMNVPHEVVGTTLSAFGTSIPELVVALIAARRSQGVAIGTLIGSNITDPMLSIGIAAMVRPIALTGGGGLIFNVIAPATIIGVCLALIFMFTQLKFNRPEGIIMCAFYALFILLLEALRVGWILPWW